MNTNSPRSIKIVSKSLKLLAYLLALNALIVPSKVIAFDHTDPSTVIALSKSVFFLLCAFYFSYSSKVVEKGALWAWRCTFIAFLLLESMYIYEFLEIIFSKSSVHPISILFVGFTNIFFLANIFALLSESCRSYFKLNSSLKILS